MERPRKGSKGTSADGSSKRSSKSRGPSEQKFKDSSKRKATERDESDSDESSVEAQKSAPKTVKKPRISLESDDGNAKSEDTGVKLQKNGEGDQYVDLGKKKRVTVRSFKGMTLVDIREYYGADGDEKPGKKGISLTVDQWKALMQASRTINDLL